MRTIVADEGICVFDFEYRRMMGKITARIEKAMDATIAEGHHEYMDLLEAQIAGYFEGSRQNFDLPLHLIGSDFQKRVWRGLTDIPYGETRSYKAQSIFLGDEQAIRAVASANGQNGIAIIIPCHRVIGANGSLVGYGGGLQRKKWLLAHERKYSGKIGQQELF